MHADLVTIVCKFDGDPAICLREETICAKVYRQTDGRTDDGRRAIALAHCWNELKTMVEPWYFFGRADFPLLINNNIIIIFVPG